MEYAHDVHSAVRTNHSSIGPGSHPRTSGQAFDMACALLGRTPQPTAVREAIAKCIIEAAKAGERDPVRLREAEN